MNSLSKSGYFKDISFKLFPGEILGITGLLGSGRTELAHALFGLYPADSGDIILHGKPVKIKSVQDAIKLGIGYVPENRLVQGLVMQQSVSKNISITTLKKLLNGLGLINLKEMARGVNQWIKNLSISVPSLDSPVQNLSGGNQQRVVLAKWIATQPKILILDGPTVGVDVAAKGAIHDIIRDLASKGVGIVVISDELAEVYHNCNRIFVMHKGRFMAEFDTESASEDEIRKFIGRSK